MRAILANPIDTEGRIEEALELVRAFYNFVHGHSSLRFGKVMRTPAIQAGIFKRALTIREIFNWVATPSRRWESRVGRVVYRCL